MSLFQQKMSSDLPMNMNIWWWEYLKSMDTDNVWNKMEDVWVFDS